MQSALGQWRSSDWTYSRSILIHGEDLEMATNRVLFSAPAAPDIETEVDANQVQFIKLGYPDKPKVPPSPSDLRHLDNKDLPITLSAEFGNSPFANFEAKEHVQLTFSGTAKDGTLISWTAAYTVPTDNDQRTLYVPSNKVKALAGQQATVIYEVSSLVQGARKVRTSGAVIFEVRGIALPPPVLVEAINDSIDPDQISKKASLNYVTVQLDYPDMAVGDTVRLVREGVDVNQNAINFVDKDRPISASNLQRRPMEITWLDTDIKPLVNGVMTLYYKVYRGGVWYTSPKKVFNVGPSLSGQPPFINEVNNGLLDPDQIVSSINLHVPPAGTMVGDKVTIHWSDTSGQTFTDQGVVTQQNVVGDMSFDIYLNPTISANRGKVVTAFYLLERTLPNGKTATFRSGDYKFFVGNKQNQAAAYARLLTIPSIAGVQNAVMDPALASKGADVVVPFAETQDGDSVTAYWQVVGEPTPAVLGTQAVDATNVSKDLSFAVPPALVKSALGKKVLGYYIISRLGVDGKMHDFRSVSLPFSVGPLAPGALLPAPLVPAAPASVLDPMNATSGTSVKVSPYPTIAIGDKVKLFWVGMAGAGSPDVPEQTVTDVNKTLEFSIPASAIGANIGVDEVWVYYQVTRAGAAAPFESDDTVVEVESLGHDDLPEPVVNEAAGGTLDLDKLKGDASVLIKKWPFITQGQRIWLRIEGTAKDGSPVQTVIWVARALLAGDVSAGVNIPIDRKKIEGLKDGSDLKVFASITHDGDFDENEAEAFPVATVTIKQPKAASAGTGSGASAGAGGAAANANTLTSGVASVSLKAAYPTDGSPAPAGSSQQLSIGGGKQPYTYASDNTGVAEVDANGLVKARGNGIAWITVTDASGLVMYIKVTITGILKLIGLNFNIYSYSKKKADDEKVRIPTLDEWKQMRAANGGTLKLELISGKTAMVWTSTPGKPNLLGRPTMIAFDASTLKEEDLHSEAGMGGTAHGFGIR
jgi:hypothetical protein